MRPVAAAVLLSLLATRADAGSFRNNGTGAYDAGNFFGHGPGLGRIGAGGVEMVELWFGCADGGHRAEDSGEGGRVEHRRGARRRPRFASTAGRRNCYAGCRPIAPRRWRRTMLIHPLTVP